MNDETGFAAPAAEVVGGEGESADPKVSYDRSPLKVLKSLEGQHFKQAAKLIEYIDAGRERERKLIKAVSTQALNLVAQNGPGYLESVQAAQ